MTAHEHDFVERTKMADSNRPNVSGEGFGASEGAYSVDRVRLEH